MVSIKISEIKISSISEINTDEMISIKGGRVLIPDEYFGVVENLEQMRFLLIPDEDKQKDLLNKKSSISVRDLDDLFSFVDVFSR